ncbi:MAG: FAD-dependent monooxygenase [Cyclobacteriaceae bacterium]|nr:FAD-dependent monooxygenase [Cyclobacteriaceae bacterium]UYN87343.1 MAG: FAD-dependent monooxygenase [Cyclobacteriaceae bacterium]
MKETKHIAIVGAGLVGSLLSIYLAKRGYKVSVYERRLDMRKHLIEGGRSINLALSNRGIRALEAVGLAEVLRQNAIPMHGRMIHDETGELNFQPYGKTGQFINSVSRGGLNMVLMTEAENHGVEFFFEHRCLGVDFSKTELTLQEYEAVKHKSFDLIIGSDGAFSAVRGAMQFTDRFEYQQTYIEHGYKELRIPASENGDYQLEPNALHIWPRESYMLIALPNPDRTFTCTLFLPFEGPSSFEQLNSKEAIQDFFEKSFADAVPMMPTLQEDFRDNATASLVTIRCYPWVRNKTLLIGDASHGIVPFFGQGMNAGFEDCRVLNELLDKHGDKWKKVLPEFQELRKPDADAIAQLALDNFIEMRDLVADEDFILRKKIEARLHEHYPDKWIPLYTMVTFRDDLRYSYALETGRKQKAIMDEVLSRPGIGKNWETINLEEIVSKL